MRTLVLILSLLLAVTNGRDWQFGSTTLDTKTFANLGTENDGQVKWCPDCQSTNPCLAAGTGAFAFGQHGGWNCAAASGVIGPTGPTGPAGPPTGPAGGDLFGTYPNPTVVAAGSGAGPFSAGRLGVGTGPDGTAGDALISNNLYVGPSSLALPQTGPGVVESDNGLVVFNNNVCAVAQYTASQASLLCLLLTDASGQPHFGGTTAFETPIIDAGSAGSVVMRVNSVTIGSFSSTALTIGSGANIGMSGNGVFQNYDGTASTQPTITAGCNGGGFVNPSNSNGDSDQDFTFSTQTAAATTCTIAFHHTWAHIPHCMFEDANATTAPITISRGATTSTTVVIDFPSTAGPYKIAGHCE